VKIVSRNRRPSTFTKRNIPVQLSPFHEEKLIFCDGFEPLQFHKVKTSPSFSGFLKVVETRIPQWIYDGMERLRLCARREQRCKKYTQ
jgi:hypothetical protein